MSNWIGGYDPDRFYTAVSYMGFGYTALSWTKKSETPYNGEYAFTTGLINKFRITPRFDIELDLRAWLMAEKSLPKSIQRGGRFAVAMSASVGVAYRFGQREWSPAYPQVEVDGYVAAIMTLEEGLVIAEQRLVAANEEISALHSKNRALQGEVDRCHAEVVEAEEITSECAVFFAIGEASLTDYARATLESYVEQIGRGGAMISVTGYADSETGSAARNEQLSKMRAEAVEAYLVDAGIPASRITTTWVGDTAIAFASPDTPLVNRCVIVK
jgi:outer membrane protein OmpA-like peptidoglycan-associated protein